MGLMTQTATAFEYELKVPLIEIVNAKAVETEAPRSKRSVSLSRLTDVPVIFIKIAIYSAILRIHRAVSA